MASNRDNITFEKTSFLQGSNSPFIKDLYLQYLKNPTAVPQSWREFFNGLDENKETVQKEILGPSWAPKKNNTLKIKTADCLPIFFFHKNHKQCTRYRFSYGINQMLGIRSYRFSISFTITLVEK